MLIAGYLNISMDNQGDRAAAALTGLPDKFGLAYIYRHSNPNKKNILFFTRIPFFRISIWVPKRLDYFFTPIEMTIHFLHYNKMNENFRIF